MKKAYLSISFQNRKNVEAEIAAIRQALSAFHIDLFVFVDTCLFNISQEKEMMQQAFADINSSDLLIAEVSEKAIGVGIEMGFAVATGKPVIYLRNAQAEHSTTAAGASNRVIIYENPEDVRKSLLTVLPSIIG